MKASNAVRTCIERTISALDSSGYALKNKNVAFAPTYKDEATGLMIPKEMFYYKDIVIQKGTGLSKPFNTLKNFKSTGPKGTFTVSELWNVLKHYQAGCVVRSWDDKAHRTKFRMGGLSDDVVQLILVPWVKTVWVWVNAVQVVVST